MTCCSANQDVTTRFRRPMGRKVAAPEPSPDLSRSHSKAERAKIQDARIAVRGNAALVDAEPQTRRHARRERQSETAAPVHLYVRQHFKVVPDHFQIQRRVAGSGARFEIHQQTRGGFRRPVEMQLRVLAGPAKRLLSGVTLYREPAIPEQNAGIGGSNIAGAQNGAAFRRNVIGALADVRFESNVCGIIDLIFHLRVHWQPGSSRRDDPCDTCVHVGAAAPRET